mgnify:CR=1 FL=1
MIRKPAVAGIFYERNPDSLKKQIEWALEKFQKKHLTKEK